MKKLIKLSENDLNRLTKKILKEDDSWARKPITMKSVIMTIEDALKEYDIDPEGHEKKIMEFAEELMYNFHSTLSYISDEGRFKDLMGEIRY